MTNNSTIKLILALILLYVIYIVLSILKKKLLNHEFF
jgi:hypothetical protein